MFLRNDLGSMCTPLAPTAVWKKCAVRLHSARLMYAIICCAITAMAGCGAAPATSRGNAAGDANAQPIMAREPRVLRAAYEADLQDPQLIPERSEQDLAAAALGRIGKPAVPQLVMAMRHRDARIRTQAAQVLAKIGPDAQSAVPQLTAALDDENLAVRKAASRALGEIGPAAQEAVPALMRTLVQPPPERR